MDILKIAVLGMVGTLLGVMLKEQKKEYELFVTLGVSLCIFYFILSKLELVLSVISQMQDYVKLDAGYIAILMKMIGITYVAEFSSNLCKDAGYQAVAGQIEMFGKLSILVISMPVLLTLLETIGEFLS
ncbi:stage III sporulation protein AD [Lachnospiraceae bacterium 3-1]|nr:stage III sporulation protein AD [Lachnospiraceae bacterium 3-1]